jgi:transposase-like protein
MGWPTLPVESVRPSRFRPPFYPWPECTAHTTRGRGFNRFGFFRRKDDPKRIPRFRCLDCRRTCSRQTFSTTYCLKRPELLVRVASGLAACSAHRQIARSELCSKTTVTRLAERLGRHALHFHARVSEHAPPLDEPVVHDHFEVFVGRQDQAVGIGTTVGSQSWFVYDVDPAPHGGSGRRPDRKPEAQAKVYRSRPYVESIKRTFSGLLALRVFPNPKRGPKGSSRSPEAVARDKAMCVADHLHQLVRHSCSDHKRETISFGRRLESILGRAQLLPVWKNFIKGRSERKPDRSTPSMRLGITDEPWTWERVLARRLFLARGALSESALRFYEKRWSASLPALELRHISRPPWLVGVDTTEVLHDTGRLELLRRRRRGIDGLHRTRHIGANQLEGPTEPGQGPGSDPELIGRDAQRFPEREDGRHAAHAKQRVREYRQLRLCGWLRESGSGR